VNRAELIEQLSKARATFYAWLEPEYRAIGEVIAILQTPGAVSDEVFAAPPVMKERQEEVDVHLLAWAVSNCHTLARRELNRLKRLPVDGALSVERWEHVQRICEKAGARSAGVLRASLLTEITDGSAAAAPPVEQERQEVHAKLSELVEVVREDRARGAQSFPQDVASGFRVAKAAYELVDALAASPSVVSEPPRLEK
jgi:hypothetical protein